MASRPLSEPHLPVGLGDNRAQLQVFIQNTPPVEPYPYLDTVATCRPGEIAQIGKLCGNGWRKVFNVYAKLLFALGDERFNQTNGYNTWQQYRDEALLQSDSNTALLFSAPQWLQGDKSSMPIRILMGRTYAKVALDGWPLEWLNQEFAICPSQRLVVSPYFDYRQLSNIKIVQLTDILHTLD